MAGLTYDEFRGIFGLKPKQRPPLPETKSQLLTIRISPEDRREMRERKLSPTKVFYHGLKELGLLEKEE